MQHLSDIRVLQISEQHEKQTWCVSKYAKLWKQTTYKVHWFRYFTIIFKIFLKLKVLHFIYLFISLFCLHVIIFMGLTVAGSAPVPAGHQGSSERSLECSYTRQQSLLRPEPWRSVVVVHAQKRAGTGAAGAGAKTHNIHAFVHPRKAGIASDVFVPKKWKERKRRKGLRESSHLHNRSWWPFGPWRSSDSSCFRSVSGTSSGDKRMLLSKCCKCHRLAW